MHPWNSQRVNQNIRAANNRNAEKKQDRFLPAVFFKEEGGIRTYPPRLMQSLTALSVRECMGECPLHLNRTHPPCVGEKAKFIFGLLKSKFYRGRTQDIAPIYSGWAKVKNFFGLRYLSKRYFLKTRGLRSLLWLCHRLGAWHLVWQKLSLMYHKLVKGRGIQRELSQMCCRIRKLRFRIPPIGEIRFPTREINSWWLSNRAARRSR